MAELPKETGSRAEGRRVRPATFSDAFLQIVELGVGRYMRILQLTNDEEVERLGPAAREKLVAQIAELNALLDVSKAWAASRIGFEIDQINQGDVKVGTNMQNLLTMRFKPKGVDVPEYTDGKQHQLSFFGRFAMTDESRDDAIASIGLNNDPSQAIERVATQAAHSSIIINTTSVSQDSTIGQKFTEPKAGIALFSQLGNPRVGIVGVDYVGRLPHYAPIDSIDASKSVFDVFEKEIKQIALVESRRRSALK